MSSLFQCNFCILLSLIFNFMSADQQRVYGAFAVQTPYCLCPGGRNSPHSFFLMGSSSTLQISVFPCFPLMPLLPSLLLVFWTSVSSRRHRHDKQEETINSNKQELQANYVTSSDNYLRSKPSNKSFIYIYHPKVLF